MNSFKEIKRKIKNPKANEVANKTYQDIQETAKVLLRRTFKQKMSTSRNGKGINI